MAAIEGVPLASSVIRNLSDRIYEKRKAAALEIETKVKDLCTAGDVEGIKKILLFLTREFALSAQSNHRKGGLIGLAAAALGLNHDTPNYLDLLLPPVLNCFTDQDSRVRYYACEALYNIAKVARGALLKNFNNVFEGLCKLCADSDVSVKNGCALLDRLMKDIITESQSFDIEKFIPLLREHIEIPNPNVRTFLVSWIILLDSVPDIELLDFLPDFMEGLFNMLSDPLREIRQQAEAALAEFLREIKRANEVDYGRMIPIVIGQVQVEDALSRRTAVFWIHEFTCLGKDAILPFAAKHNLLGSLLQAISQTEDDIRTAASAAAYDLKHLVHSTGYAINVGALLSQATSQLTNACQQTRLSSLDWISMLLKKVPEGVCAHLDVLFPSLLAVLLDEDDDVVRVDMDVLSTISKLNRSYFTRFIEDFLRLMKTTPEEPHMVAGRPKEITAGVLSDSRRDLIVREICIRLDAEIIYRAFADATAALPNSTAQETRFAARTVQQLNLILLTASELEAPRKLLRECSTNSNGQSLFETLYLSWCRDPPTSLSLCLLAQNYFLAAELVERLAQLEVSVDLLVQLDRLVQLIESPIFASLRIQLLYPNKYPYLHRALYGILLLLPQCSAFHILRKRLSAVPTNALLQLNLSIDNLAAEDRPPEMQKQIDVSEKLVKHFDAKVTEAATAVKITAIETSQPHGLSVSLSSHSSPERLSALPSPKMI